MPKIDIDAVAVVRRTGYPPPLSAAVAGRSWRSLGDAAGLTQFGVRLVRIEPGAASSQRHWHEQEDEFVYIIAGELLLVEDGGETLMRAGDAAGFPAGVANGHQFVNRSPVDAMFLVVGTRASHDRCHYTDVDLEYVRDQTSAAYYHKSGEPYARDA